MRLRSIAGLIALGLLVALRAAGAPPVVVPAAGVSGAAACEVGQPAIAYHPHGPVLPTGDRISLIPCRYDTGAIAMEPSFEFAPDGRILYEAWGTSQGAIGGLPAVSHVVRSSRDFVSWTDVSPTGPQLHPQSLDPYLYLDARTGRVFTLDWVSHGVPFCATLSFSDNAGDSWTTTPLACGGFDGESIGAGPPVSTPTLGYKDVVYYCTQSELGGSQPLTTPLCSKSIDGGLTFVPTGGLPYPPMGQQDVFAQWPGNPVVGSDGTLYLPKRSEGQPSLAISHDEGMTWTRVVVARNGAAGNATRVDVDHVGNLYYTWPAGDHLPYVATSRDGGKTWSAPLLIAPPGLRESAFPRLAVDGVGRVAVVYLGSTNAPGHEPFYASCNVFLSDCADGPYAGATWNGYMTLIDNVFDSTPLIQTATVNPKGMPLFTGGCSADAACKGVLDFLDVHFDAAHTAWGAFVDDCQLSRQFTPVFNASAGPCEDGVGEGILGRLMPEVLTAAPAAGPAGLPNTSP